MIYKDIVQEGYEEVEYENLDEQEGYGGGGYF
jgi:hypothetical protein